MKLESSIQTEILQWLKHHGFLVYKHPAYPTGMPDIHAIKDGRHYWFEVKRSKADFRKKFKNKAIQALRRRELQYAGDTAEVVWSLEMVKKIIKEGL